MRVKINERRNGSPVIYFQIRWGFLSVHNAFKVIRESQRPSSVIVISFLFEYANLCEQIYHLLMTALGPVLNAPEGKLENRVFTLKTHQMFSVHTMPETFQNATITGNF